MPHERANEKKPEPRDERAASAQFRMRLRAIEELERLHAEVGELAEATRAWSGRSARRRLHEARQAEADLLRVLDFPSWGSFVVFAQDQMLNQLSGRSRPDRSVAQRAPAVPIATDTHAQRSETRAAPAAPVGPPPPEPTEPPDPRLTVVATSVSVPAPESPPSRGEGSSPDLDAMQARMQSLRSEIESALAELGTLRGVAGEIRDQMERATAEVVALRLECVVLKRREQAE
jgi:hypothetical protein